MIRISLLAHLKHVIVARYCSLTDIMISTSLEMFCLNRSIGARYNDFYSTKGFSSTLPKLFKDVKLFFSDNKFILQANKQATKDILLYCQFGMGRPFSETKNHLSSCLHFPLTRM